MKFSENTPSVYLGCKSGQVYTYTLHDQEAELNKIMKGTKKIKSVDYDHERHFVVTSDLNGNISFFNEEESQPTLVFNAHKKEITRIAYVTPSLVMSTGKDKRVRMWQLPSGDQFFNSEEEKSESSADLNDQDREIDEFIKQTKEEIFDSDSEGEGGSMKTSKSALRHEPTEAKHDSMPPAAPVFCADDVDDDE